MKDRQFSIDLCADIIEFITDKLLEFTKSESETLKIIKIGALRAIDNVQKEEK